jgi:trehalose-6-phosphate synthase
MHRSVSEPELIALYRAADAMVVTPLRDGMNLVAKEFVASAALLI